MGKELLLEIGTEEIPAAFLPKAIKDMEDMIRKILSEKRIGHGAVQAMATPRRLCLYLADVAEKQEDQLIEKLGPAKRVAFDENGNPSKALAGFARGQGMKIEDLISVTTEKGEYLCARKMIAGEPTAALLPDIFAKFITAIPFKKSMRWSDMELRFARPIHWILALFGGEVVPFRIEDINAGNETRGHRFMSPEPVAVKDFQDYLAKTKEKYVIVNPDERRNIIVEEADRAAAAVGGQVLRNDDLLEVVTFLTEYPTAVCGSYDSGYLELPPEVLITSMMSHQKYFPVIDAKGKLMPYFITINNTLARDPSVVARGNEKVIRARLSDARFFFQEDQKISLDKRVEDLQKVVFHSQLGTSYAKVMRFRKLAACIAHRVNPALTAAVDRAATLAKADLETQMVGEFSELQGVMGREYALLAGEDPVIATAIYEHYLPTAAGGELPSTDEGAMVSIADKMDTIVGFFGIGLVPTGTADPYALRRQALGIINIILNKQYPLPLEDLIDESINILNDLLKKPRAEVKAEVLEFFKARYENQLISQGHPYDVVDSVLATGISDIPGTFKKIEAMEAFKNHVDYEPLAIAFKRAGNIIKDFHGGSIDPALFESEEERNLFSAFRALQQKATAHIENGDYQGALMEMALLRKPVDAFFESVLVMAKDDKIRLNRLSLLEEISTFFRRVADFSKIVTESRT